jgi:hypothetical protein
VAASVPTLALLALTGHSAEAQIAGGIGVALMAPVTILLAQFTQGAPESQAAPLASVAPPALVPPLCPVQITVHIHRSPDDHTQVGP